MKKLEASIIKNTSEHQLVAFYQFSLGTSLIEVKRTKRGRKSRKQRKDKEIKGK